MPLARRKSIRRRLPSIGLVEARKSWLTARLLGTWFGRRESDRHRRHAWSMEVPRTEDAGYVAMVTLVPTDDGDGGDGEGGRQDFWESFYLLGDFN